MKHLMILKIVQRQLHQGKFDKHQLTNLCINNRWCVFEMEWEDGDRKLSKVILIAFAPDNAANNGQKFVVAANKGMLQNKLKTNRDFQINSWDDIDFDALKSKF